MTKVGERLDAVKNPEYTGENRCLPCTAVNLVMAIVVAAAVALAAATADAGTLAPLLAAAVLVASVAAIYVRGYLVPGTPALTKRYAPEWFLALFGKAQPATGGQPGADGDGGEFDVETLLVEGGVLTEQPDGRDLTLTAAFRDALHDEIDAVRDEEASRERLLDVLDVDGGEITFTEHGQAFRAERDGARLGTWESRPAFLADVAAGELLAERIAGWDDLSVPQRGQTLNGLRLFLTTCPGCGGDLAFGTETVESCCSTHEVAAVECDDCGARLFESRAVP